MPLAENKAWGSSATPWLVTPFSHKTVAADQHLLSSPFITSKLHTVPHQVLGMFLLY